MHIYPKFLALQIVLSRLPYFYIIKHIASGAYYAGYKCRKPNSLAFMKTGGYQTSSKTVKNIIEREGLDSFRIVRIHHFETKEEVFEYETQFLKKVCVPYNPRFLNQHVANNFGMAGKKFSEEHKEKLRRPRGPSGPQKNPKGSISEEHKAKIRAANLGKKLSKEHKAKLRGPRGPHSEETKVKIRAALLSKKLSEEHKAKIRVAHLGKKLSKEHKAKIRAALLRKNHLVSSYSS